MTTISAGLVKELREKTGVGMMECKKALEETGGVMDKAIVWLREKGMAKAAKKSGRVAAEGMVQVAISDDGHTAALIELNCETDFAARNEEFIGFAKKVGDLAKTGAYKTVEELSTAKIDGTAVDETLKALISKIGENMNLRRMELFQISNGALFGYSHMGGKIGCLVALEGVSATDDKAKEIGKEVAMHIAAAAPRFLTRDQVDSAEVDQEKEIARKKLIEEGKPADKIDMILAGHVNKFYKDVCLVDQPYTRDPKLSIEQFVKASGLKASVKSFARFQLGEGIEKKQEDFAAEVAAQIKG